MSFLAIALAAVASTASTTPAASAPRPPESPLDVLKLLAREGGVSGTDTAPLGEGEKSALEDPATLNDALTKVLQPGHGWRFLSDVDWKLKTFEEDGEASLGMAFAYRKSAPTKVWDHSDGRGVSGLGVDFDVQGNMAFEDDVNPNDFISTRLAVDFFRSRGGTRDVLAPEQQLRATELATAASAYEDRDQWLRSDEWKELKQLAHQVLTTQFYWEFGLDTSFETDQEFDAKNYTLGAHVALDVKAWNEKSEIATLNLFDYPAALVRFLTGYDEELRPRGSSIPTLVLGLDHVEPDGDTPRSAVGDESSYGRVRAELAYKAPLAILEGKEYYLTAVYRMYRELDPSDAVQSADLDNLNYLTIAFETEDGLFASFSKGQLPFDDDDAEVFSLGWRFQF